MIILKTRKLRTATIYEVFRLTKLTPKLLAKVWLSNNDTLNHSEELRKSVKFLRNEKVVTI